MIITFYVLKINQSVKKALFCYRQTSRPLQVCAAHNGTFQQGESFISFFICLMSVQVSTYCQVFNICILLEVCIEKLG